MSEPSLTEFLLARIAEDERHARKLAESDRRPVLCLATTVNHPERLLLEVKAKRQIVGLHTPVDENPDGWCNLCDGDGWPCGTMAALALLYADHDEYRDEWRP